MRCETWKNLSADSNYFIMGSRNVGNAGDIKIPYARFTPSPKYCILPNCRITFTITYGCINSHSPCSNPLGTCPRDFFLVMFGDPDWMKFVSFGNALYSQLWVCEKKFQYPCQVLIGVLQGKQKHIFTRCKRLLSDSGIVSTVYCFWNLSNIFNMMKNPENFNPALTPFLPLFFRVKYQFSP
jgi:hypothetical protein